MKQIQLQTVDRAVAFLNAAGVDYKVILPDGTEYGDLEVVVLKRRTRNQRIAHGTMTGLYKQQINNAEVGDVIQVSIADIEALGAKPESLRSAATAHASLTWGNGTYTSIVTDTHVEILRIE